MTIIRPIPPPIVRPTLDPLASGALPWEAQGGGAPYDPAQESGYAFDLWASYGVTEAGTGVSSWVERKASYDFVQSTDANRPSYVAAWSNGRAAVDFNGSSNRLRKTSGIADDSIVAAGVSVTAYLFGELDTLNGAAADNFVIDFAAGSLVLTMETNANQGGWFDGGYRSVGVAPSTGKHVWTWALAHGGTGTLYQDGVSLGTSTFTGNGLGGVTAIGSANDGTAQYLDGKIGRLLIFSGLHDAATRARIEAWGTEYYGL